MAASTGAALSPGHRPVGSGDPRGAVVGAADLATGVVGGGNGEPGDPRQTMFHALRLRAKAPKVAKMDELLSVRDSLRSDISQGKMEAKMELAAVSHKLSTELHDLRASFERTTAEAAEDRERRSIEALAFAEGCHARLQQELRVVAASLEARLLGSVAEIDMALQAARTRELLCEEAAERRVALLAAEVSAAAAVRWASMGALLAEQRGALGAEMEALAGELAARCDGALASMYSVSERLQSRQDEGHQAHAVRAAGLEGELRGRCEQLEALFGRHRASGEEQVQVLSELTQGQVADIRSETQARLAWLDEQARSLRGLVAEVENIPTRRVEWLIPNASAKLLELQCGFLRSPTFEAAGAHGLQLELRQLSGGGTSSREVLGAEACAEADCELALWAKQGLFLVCRLYIGGASVQLQHTFDGQSPCVARRLCLLRDQVCQQDDSLRVGLEVLEAVREVLHSAPALSSADALLGRVGGEAAAQQGSIVTYRYLNHRMLDLVQSQVERMQSRMVRRIEWRIEQGSVLRRCFPEGECLCSTTFEAAGLEGLQLIFYPSGYTAAKEGYCSYFLHCPAGSALQCWLCIGKQRHKAKLSFERPGLYGRTNFCRFDFCVEAADDSVLLVLEIEEAQQNVTETLSHAAAAPAEVRGAAAGPTMSLSTSTAAPEQLPEKVDSSVKFRRAPGRSALEDVRQLPSIWTPRPQTNVAEALEGFHTFNDLKVRRPPTSARRAVSSASCRGETSTPPGAGGLAAAHPGQRYMMYAA